MSLDLDTLCCIYARQMTNATMNSEIYDVHPSNKCNIFYQWTQLIANHVWRMGTTGLIILKTERFTESIKIEQNQ